MEKSLFLVGCLFMAACTGGGSSSGPNNQCPDLVGTYHLEMDPTQTMRFEKNSKGQLVEIGGKEGPVTFDGTEQPAEFESGKATAVPTCSNNNLVISFKANGKSSQMIISKSAKGYTLSEGSESIEWIRDGGAADASVAPGTTGAGELIAIGAGHRPNECPNLQNGTYHSSIDATAKTTISRNEKGEIVSTDSGQVVVNGIVQMTEKGGQGVAYCTQGTIKLVFIESNGDKHEGSLRLSAQGYEIMVTGQTEQWIRE